MKNQFVILVLAILTFGISFSGFSQSDGALEFTLTISNIKSSDGQMMIAVFDPSQKFLGEDFSAGLKVSITEIPEMKIAIKDLPFGEYAISVFHDKNSNEELDSGMFKIPKEPYGFSNNAMGTFGPPKFEKAKFEFKANGQEFSIRLK